MRYWLILPFVILLTIWLVMTLPADAAEDWGR